MGVELKKPTAVGAPRIRSLGSRSSILTGDEIVLNEQPGGSPLIISGYIDLGNLIGGDIVIISMYIKVRAESAFRLYHADTFSGPVIPPIVYVAKRPENHGMLVTIQQTAGSFKSIDYEFYEED